MSELPFDPHDVERRWQSRWDADGLFELDTAELDRAELGTAGDGYGEKFYNLVEFPYPSGEGLHVGHAMTYCGADVVGRYQRMRGRRVFQPMAFDAFGINAENFALREGVHPADLIARTTAYFRHAQLSRLGCAWNWREEVTTCDPRYYRWTQWIFLRLFEAGLAYQAESPVTWCPSCMTVLAHEQVEDGSCERCGSRVTQRTMRQWFLRITAYADRLLAGLQSLDWPERAKRAQAGWIGRSSGVEVDFGDLCVFTTRPETLMGVAFLAVAVDHPLAAAGADDAVAEFCEAARSRAAAGGQPSAKRGIALGVSRPHPVTGALVPVYVADYVLPGYGTGAVMGVPAHDRRDREFALAMGIGYEQAPLLPPAETEVAGRPATRYRLRDWLISRQRYWGPPIPVVHCPGCGAVPVPDGDLPVLLPEVDAESVRPTSGASPLAAVESWVRTSCPRCGGAARRDTDVSDTFFDSSWYFLRYPSASQDDGPFDAELTRRWLPVDLYAGGPEHVARHHLYARFVTMALHDLGLVDIEEPFPRIRLHGFITRHGAKLAKSKGSIIRPEDYIARHGSDVLRLHLLFCCRWEDGGDWKDEAIAGAERFVSRAWRAVEACGGRTAVDDDAGLLESVARASGRIALAIETMRFNVGVAALMELLNGLGEDPPREAVRAFVLMLAPFAPYLAEELWSMLQGSEGSVHRQRWPSAATPPGSADGEAAEIGLSVQLDGRHRAVVKVPAAASEGEIERIVLADPRVAVRLEQRRLTRVVHIRGRAVALCSVEAGSA